MGRGRRPHSKNSMSSAATKLVCDWLHQDHEAGNYWKKQAEEQRESARWSREVKENGDPLERTAIRRLTIQLQEEIKREIPTKVTGLYRDLLQEVMQDVNWAELAEDLIQP